tara:strand:- start:184 stop:306 length:123 start_codon:yes stop_codon:yes gene_type:complete
MIQNPKLDKVHLGLLEELAKKHRLKPDQYLMELIRVAYNG